MSEWDAPNQQVVRADASPPWEEGTGGDPDQPVADPLDSMTKAELLEEADRRGVEVDSSATKAEIREALEGGDDE
jgi:hypothetical protein